jgi:hypothetical protein
MTRQQSPTRYSRHTVATASPHALELVTGWAFHDLRLSRLLLEIDEANTASIRVAQKCGFVRRVTVGAVRDSDGDDRPKAVFVRRPP